MTAARTENRSAYSAGALSLHSSPGPIFIVGPSRSGTTLLRRLLNSHSLVGIADETHYFDDLRQRVGGAAPLGLDQRGQVASYFAALRSREYMFGAGLSNAGLAHSASAIDDTGAFATADEAFADYCRQVAVDDGKVIWGEKTPRHLFRVEDILAAFPTARIIIMIRDPRAVIASHRDWRNGWLNAHADVGGLAREIAREAKRMRRSYNLTVAALIWRASAVTAMRLDQGARSRSVRLVPFEALVTQPRETLQSLLAWLGLTLEPTMLQTIVSKSSYHAEEQTDGFNTAALARWKHQLSAAEIAYVDALCSGVAARLGYRRAGLRLKPGFTFKELGKVPFCLILAANANRHRIGNLGQFVIARVQALRP